MKTEFKKAINCIIDRDDTTARQIIKETIQNDNRYKNYKKTLQEYGFNFETIDVPEKTYTDLKEVLKDFPNEVKLKVLDETWKLIKNEKEK